MWKLAHTHLLACAAHVMSGILFLTLSKSPIPWTPRFHVNAWAPQDGYENCEDVLCRTVDVAVEYTIDPIALCVLFAWWSGLCHMFAFSRTYNDTDKNSPVSSTQKEYLRTIRALDYAVSSPIMLVVVSWLCGSNDYGQLIATAAAMSSVVLIDFFGAKAATSVIVNDSTPGPKFIAQKSNTAQDVKHYSKETKLAMFAWTTAAVIYIALWIPIFMNFVAATGKLQLPDAFGGQESRPAPDFVIVIVVGIFMTFSSFALLRLWVILGGCGCKTACVPKWFNHTNFAVEETLFIVSASRWLLCGKRGGSMVGDIV